MKIEDKKDLQGLFLISLIFRLITLPIGPLGQLIMGLIIVMINLVFFLQLIKLKKYTEIKFMIMGGVELLILLFTGYALYWGIITVLI